MTSDVVIYDSLEINDRLEAQEAKTWMVALPTARRDIPLPVLRIPVARLKVERLGFPILKMVKIILGGDDCILGRGIVIRYQSSFWSTWVEQKWRNSIHSSSFKLGKLRAFFVTSLLVFWHLKWDPWNKPYKKKTKTKTQFTNAIMFPLLDRPRKRKREPKLNVCHLKIPQSLANGFFCWTGCVSLSSHNPTWRMLSCINIFSPSRLQPHELLAY